MIMISFKKRILTAVFRHNCRRFSLSRNTQAEKKGLVLGVYEKEKEDENLRFTEAAETFDRSLSGRLRELLSTSGPPLKKGKSRVFYGIHEEFPSVVVVGLGKNAPGICDKENWDISKENIRAALSAGCRVLQDLEVPLVEVDPCRDAQAAAEGAVLGLFQYDEFKRKKKFVVKTRLHGNQEFYNLSSWKGAIMWTVWQRAGRERKREPIVGPQGPDWETDLKE